MYLRNLNGDEFPLMATYTKEDEINGNYSIQMEILPWPVNLVFLKDLSEFWELIDDKEEVFIINRCTKSASGIEQAKTIQAIPKIYDVMDSTRVYARFEGSYSVAQLLEAVFEPVPYQYNLIGSWNNIEVQGYGDGETCLSMLQKILERIKAEFTFIGDSMTIREKIGTDKDVMYRYRLNADNIVHEVDGQEFYTYAKGFGDFEDEGDSGWEKAKLKRDYTSPLAKIIGKREAPPVKDGRVKHASKMDENLKNLVDNSIKISVTANLYDLSKHGYPYAVTNLGDTVWLIDERIQLEEQVRVVKRSITYDWKGNIIDLSFTFGSQGLVDRYNGKLSNAVNTINDILSGTVKLPFAAMSSEIQIVTKILTTVKTQLTTTEDGSVIARDKDDPNNLVIFNAGGLGVSDDGGKTFKSAITGRGIMGDLIVANTIKVDALEANFVSVGFNKYSDNIELHGDRIDFYNSGHKLTSRLTDRGQEFWYGNRYIGDMGESGKEGNPNVRGISLRLANTGDYLSFAYLKNASDKSYTVMLTMDPGGKMTNWKGIQVGMPMQVVDNNGYSYELHDALHVANQLKGQKLAIATDFDSDGTAKSWVYFNF